MPSMVKILDLRYPSIAKNENLQSLHLIHIFITTWPTNALTTIVAGNLHKLPEDKKSIVVLSDLHFGQQITFRSD